MVPHDVRKLRSWRRLIRLERCRRAAYQICLRHHAEVATVPRVASVVAEDEIVPGRNHLVAVPGRPVEQMSDAYGFAVEYFTDIFEVVVRSSGSGRHRDAVDGEPPVATLDVIARQADHAFQINRVLIARQEE